jgi:hypothetical protein
MIRQPTLLALCIALALGTAQAAPEPDPEAVIPRVSCDLLDVRTAAAGPRTQPTVTGEGVPVTAPPIRQVGGAAVRRTSSAPERRGGLLRVGMGQSGSGAMELGPRNVTLAAGTTALIEIAIDHREPLASADRAQADRLSVLMNLDWPAETLVQIALWASPDIEERLARMQALRIGHGDDLLRASTQRRAGTEAPLGPASEL